MPDDKAQLILYRLDELKNDVAAVHTQAKATNGRVSKLENWRWFITGGVSILAAIVIPLVVYIFLTHK